MEEAAALLASCERPPVILAGRGAVAADARAEIEALAERIGAVLATTVHAKGYFDHHPWNVGIAGSFSSELAVEFLASADCVLALGCSLNKYTTHSGRLFSRARIIHVDRDPKQLGKITPADLCIVGDARETVAAIRRCLESDGRIQNRFWNAETERYLASARGARPDYVEAADGLDPRLVIAECERLLPKDRIAVVDGGHFGCWVIEGFSVPHPNDFIWRVDFSAIGLGLPLGIGAATAAPDRHCVVFAGDGGFMMILQELETAARYQVPMTVIVMNDRALGAEYHVMQRENKPPQLATHSTPDFARVAAALGARGFAVRTLDDLRAALSEAAANDAGGPTVIDVPITRQVAHPVFG
ncbi:MAG TPA: thiamine pyrophosphate-dependent enzyme [Bacillota bacterium]